MTSKLCKTCGHEKKYHRPSQYYEGKDCHIFIKEERTDYERCGCKNFKARKRGRPADKWEVAKAK